MNTDSWARLQTTSMTWNHGDVSGGNIWRQHLIPFPEQTIFNLHVSVGCNVLSEPPGKRARAFWWTFAHLLVRIDYACRVVHAVRFIFLCYFRHCNETVKCSIYIKSQTVCVTSEDDALLMKSMEYIQYCSHNVINVEVLLFHREQVSVSFFRHIVCFFVAVGNFWEMINKRKSLQKLRHQVRTQCL